MLVLTRRVGESIIINDNVKIYFLEQKNGAQVRFGIEAPKEVKILRAELKDRSKKSEYL